MKRQTGRGSPKAGEYNDSCFTFLGRESGPVERLEIKLSPDQEDAYAHIRRFLQGSDKLLTFGGFAGTGKTTLLALLAADLHNQHTAFVAFTGKATNVLRTKLQAVGALSPKHITSTIHSLIYQVFETSVRVKYACKPCNATYDEKEVDVLTPLCPECAAVLEVKEQSEGGKVSFSKRELAEGEVPPVTIVDEGSMLLPEMLADLLSTGTRVILAGDHGQLPPVGGSGSLLANPDVRLEKIHRQAEGNPILELASIVRETGALPRTLPAGEAGKGKCQYVDGAKLEPLLTALYTHRELRDVAVLVGMNKTRVRTNKLARRVLFDDDADIPVEGDQMICLRNAFRIAFNGMRGEVVQAGNARKVSFDGEIAFPDEGIAFKGPASRLMLHREKGLENLFEAKRLGASHAKTWDDLGLLCDYGYALTVHKAQGSQFKDVVLMPERFSSMSNDDYRRWLYTAVTRASDRLHIVR